MGAAATVCAANAITATTHALRIDSAASTLQLISSHVDPGLPPGPLLPFGGLLEVTTVEYYVDTLDNGLPTGPLAFASLRLRFLALDLPPEAPDFAPGDPFFSFELLGDTIPGAYHDPCRYTRATGGSCTVLTSSFGHPESLSGTFDGARLDVSGAPAHGFFDSFYTFTISASPVPLPPTLAVFATSVLVLARHSRRRNGVVHRRARVAGHRRALPRPLPR